MTRNTATPSPWQLCVAPMMDWTDRYCRRFHRQLAPHARLYTEMVTSAAVVHGDRQHLLGFDRAEHPLAVQLGGSDPHQLAEAARIAEGFGYDEVNLNVGCPSDRVQSGRFGACLMREPELVARCVAAMRRSVQIPVTVKCRLAVDDQSEDTALENLACAVMGAGIEVLIVHARKAWLQGLSPKDNRTVPPLNPARVQRLKREHPDLTVVLNGGLRDAAAVHEQLPYLDGVMLGRAAYQQPWLLAELEHSLYGGVMAQREAVLAQLRPWVEARLDAGVPLKRITRHMLGLYHGQPGGRRFRRCLAENAHRPDAGFAVLQQAVEATRVRARVTCSAGVSASADGSVTMSPC